MVERIGHAVAGAADRVPSACAAALMLAAAWLPLLGAAPGPGLRLLAALAVACLLVGGFVLPRGTPRAVCLLWASFGAALGLGALGVFSVGMIFLPAAALILLAIFATPDRSGAPARFGWRQFLCDAGGFGFVIGTAVI